MPCQRCEDRKLFQANREYHGETWSGWVNGEKRWYNVSLAKSTLAQCPPIDVSLLEKFDVHALWESQIRNCVIEESHIDHIDVNDPILLATTHRTEVGDYFSVIDGIHRIARARQDKQLMIRGVVLSLAFSNQILIPPEEAVFDELVTEIVMTGGRVGRVGQTVIISGGNPAPQAKDDHPARAALLKTIRGGPAVYPFKR